MLNIIFTLFCTHTSVFLLPNDAIEVKIWRQEDVSGWYIVDADTNVNIPLLGRFPVRDIATDSLQSYLVGAFKNYYGDVVVEINFYYRINVFGEVMQPGHYYVKHGDNLTNLLAQAGGPTEDGTLGGIRILNIGSERTVDFERIMRSGQDVDQLYLQPGDIVIVPRRFMAAFQEWTAFLSVGTLLLQIYLVASQ